MPKKRRTSGNGRNQSTINGKGDHPKPNGHAAKQGRTLKSERPQHNSHVVHRGIWYVQQAARRIHRGEVLFCANDDDVIVVRSGAVTTVRIKPEAWAKYVAKPAKKNRHRREGFDAE